MKDRIESALRKACPTSAMENLLKYMDKNGYYTCHSSSHNHWLGGASEHMWTCYQIAMEKKAEILADKPYLLKYATNEKLAIVCLLHDLCDMRGILVKKDSQHNYEDVSNNHGQKSYWIMRNYQVGTAAEQKAVLNHMHRHAKSGFNDKIANEEYEALYTIILKVDHIASGVTWSSDRFKNGLTQLHGIKASPGYLRAVALDRTKQCLEDNVYLDYNLFSHVIKGYNRDKIVWNYRTDLMDYAKSEVNNISKDVDIITQLNEKIVSDKECILIIGVDPSIPDDADKRLRGKWKYEQNLLICSNILNALYYRDKSTVTVKKHHYGFTMQDTIKQHYKLQSLNKGIFLPNVTFFRDGDSEGFRMVAPWTCDVLLLPGVKDFVHIEE